MKVKQSKLPKAPAQCPPTPANPTRQHYQMAAGKCKKS